MKKNIVLLTVMSQFCTSLPEQNNVAPYFALQPQDRTTAREWSLWRADQQTTSKETITGSFAVQLLFQKTFRSKKISHALFGNALVEQTASSDDDSKSLMTVSGSQTTDRGTFDLLADYFYLPSDFKSTLSISPSIRQCIIDLHYRMNLNAWIKGLYIKIKTPLVHCKTDINLNETIINKGINGHAAGYFVNTTDLTRQKLLQSATDFFSGNQISNIDNTIFQPLNFGKIRTKSSEQFGSGDLHIEVGYDCCQAERYAIGFAFETVAPSGKRPQGKFLLEPQIGGGHHWEFGGSVHGNFKIWNNQQETKTLTVLFDIHATHIFKAKQMRVFDLKNSILSRYMLAEQLTTAPTDTALIGQAGPIAYIFNKQFTPIANITAQPTDASATIQGTMLGMLNFTYNHFSGNIGFDIWARTKEHLELMSDNIFKNNTTWAVKGDSQVYGFTPTASFPLSATQNSATIFSGNNYPKTGATTPSLVTAGQQNPGIDNKTLASEGNPAAPLNISPSIVTQIFTSQNPRFIQESDLNIEGAATKAGACSVFANINYSCNERHGWTPNVGIGSQASFGHGNKNNSSDHILCPIWQWNIWLSGAVYY